MLQPQPQEIRAENFTDAEEGMNGGASPFW